MSSTFTLKKVDTFPLVIEIDCEFGKGKLTLDCKPLNRPEMSKLLEDGATIDDLFVKLVTAVHGAPAADGSELEGDAALQFFINGPISNYLMPAFREAYFEQYSEARRKNGQRLPRR